MMLGVLATEAQGSSKQNTLQQQLLLLLTLYQRLQQAVPEQPML